MTIAELKEKIKDPQDEMDIYLGTTNDLVELDNIRSDDNLLYLEGGQYY